MPQMSRRAPLSALFKAHACHSAVFLCPFQRQQQVPPACTDTQHPEVLHYPQLQRRMLALLLLSSFHSRPTSDVHS